MLNWKYQALHYRHTFHDCAACTLMVKSSQVGKGLTNVGATVI